MFHIDWQAFLIDYGYWTIFLGTFLEGESILVMGGYAAHQGYLGLPQVLLAAFAGSFFGDQLYFVIGRRYGPSLLQARPAWQPRVARVYRLLERYQTIYILGFRFLYGLRTISPFVLGTGTVRSSTFVLLNALGAMVWTLSVGLIGYAFGEVVTRYLGFVRAYEAYLAGVLIVFGIMTAIVLHKRAKRRGLAQANAAVAPQPPTAPPTSTQASP